MTPPSDAVAGALPDAEPAARPAPPGARRTARAAMWAALDTISQTFVSIFSFLIVARILGPTDFGVAAISFGIYQIVNLFVETLLQDAVVQRANLTRRQTSSAFWWNVGSAVIGVIILVSAAPLFAWLLGAPAITNLLRVMSLGLLFTGSGAVPVALLRRSLSFRSLTTCSIITRVVTGCSSAGLALAGAGAFALVAQTTIGPLLLTSLVIGISGWRPSAEFSWRELRALLTFGLHVVGGQLIWIGALRLYIICIGLLFSPTAVGFYNIAQRVVDTARETISSAVSSLSLPVLSRYQHDHAQFRRAVGQGTELLCLLVLPIFAMIGGCAVPLVHLLLTDKWLAAVPIIQLFAASAMLHFFRFLQTPAIIAAGRPDLGLLLGVLSAVASFAFLLAFGRHSFFLAAAGWAFVRLLVQFPVAALVLQRTIGLPVRSQILGGLAVATAAMLAGVAAYIAATLTNADFGTSILGDCAAIIAGGLSAVAVHGALVAIFARPTLLAAYGIVRVALRTSA